MYNERGGDSEDPQQRVPSQVPGSCQWHSSAANPPPCLSTSSTLCPLALLSGIQGRTRSVPEHGATAVGSLEPESCRSVPGCAWRLLPSYCWLCNSGGDKLSRLHSSKQGCLPLLVSAIRGAKAECQIINRTGFFLLACLTQCIPPRSEISV